MNGNMKYLVILAVSLILGAGGTAQATQFSAAMTNDWYNVNAPNSIPTPQYTPGQGLDLFNAANLLNTAYRFRKNENLDTHLVLQDQSFQTLDGSVSSIYVIGSTTTSVDAIGYYQKVWNVQTQTFDIVKSSPLFCGITGYNWTGTGGSSGSPIPSGRAVPSDPGR